MIELMATRVVLRRRLPARTAAVAAVTAFVLFVVSVNAVSRVGSLWDGPPRVGSLALCCLALAAAPWLPKHAVLLAGAGLLVAAATGAFPLLGYLAAVAALALVARSDRRAALVGAALLPAFFLLGELAPHAQGDTVLPSFTDPPGALWLLAGVAVVAVVAGLALPRRDPGPAAPAMTFLGRPPVVTPQEVLAVAVVVAVTALRSASMFSMPAMTALPYGATDLLPPGGTALVVGLFCVVLAAVATSPWFPRGGFAVATAGFAVELAVTAAGGVIFVPPLTGASVAALYVLARSMLQSGGRRAAGPRLAVPLALTTLLGALLGTAAEVSGLFREAAALGTPLSGLPADDSARLVADVVLRALASSAVLPALAVAAAWLVTRWLADRERLAGAAAREAAVAERGRIARELHDVVAHHVSLVTVRAESAPYLVPDLPGPARDAFGEIARTSRQALDELRDVLQVLGRPEGDPELAPQPTLSDVPGLVAAARQAGAQVRFDGLPDVADVPAGAALAAHAVVREGLSNARRHAPGEPVTVAVTAQEDVLVVEVTNPLTTAGSGDGLGLAGLRGRAAAVGGTLAAGPDSGVFRLVARLPLHRSAEHRQDGA